MRGACWYGGAKAQGQGKRVRGGAERSLLLQVKGRESRPARNEEEIDRKVGRHEMGGSLK